MSSCGPKEVCFISSFAFCLLLGTRASLRTERSDVRTGLLASLLGAIELLGTRASSHRGVANDARGQATRENATSSLDSALNEQGTLSSGSQLLRPFPWFQAHSLTSSNKKLVETGATLVVTGALLVVTRSLDSKERLV